MWPFKKHEPSAEHQAEQKALRYAESLRTIPTDEKFQRYMAEYAEAKRKWAGDLNSLTTISSNAPVTAHFTPGEVVMWAHRKYGETW